MSDQTDESTIARPSNGYGAAATAIQRQGFGSQEMELRRETQGAALAEKAKAEIQARYIMALQRPRDVDDFRVRLLKHCGRVGFAEKAEYAKPVGGTKIVGPSIRFVETALQEYRNAFPEVSIVYEDDDKRIVRVSVTDLEANLTYNDECLVEKFVERRKPKSGDEVIGSRKNSYGDVVFRIRATEDDFTNKQNAAVSKKIRNLGLRILPADIVEECMAKCAATRRAEVQADPDAVRRKVTDAFAGISVMPSDLKEYLGHELDQSAPAELDELRAVYQTIKDGEATWPAALAAKKAERGEIEEPTKQGNEAAKKVAAKILEQKQARSKAHAPTAPVEPKDAPKDDAA